LNVKDGDALLEGGSGSVDGSTKGETPAATTNGEEPGSKVIVIHPGARTLRIGRASDNIPLPVPNVIARRLKDPSRKHKYIPSPTQKDDTLDEKIESIRSEIKNRMKHFKIRHQLNASPEAAKYNTAVHPEIVAEFNDPFRVDWTDTQDPKDEFIVGEHVRMNCPSVARLRSIISYRHSRSLVQKKKASSCGGLSREALSTRNTTIRRQKSWPISKTSSVPSLASTLRSPLIAFRFVRIVFFERAGRDHHGRSTLSFSLFQTRTTRSTCEK
jgi:hypothetical protein